MEIHVYDTYVKAKDGHTIHFDVITGEKDHDKAVEYGKKMAILNWGRGSKYDNERVSILSLTRCT